MIYKLVLSLRHLFYDKGWKKSYKAKVPTVCVGNITVGGTGKTPHTEMILRLLLQSEPWGRRQLAVLSRGYKRKSHGFQVAGTDADAYRMATSRCRWRASSPWSPWLWTRTVSTAASS